MALIYNDLLNMDREEAIKAIDEADVNGEDFSEYFTDKEMAIVYYLQGSVYTEAGHMRFWETIIEAKYDYTDKEIEIISEYADGGYLDYSSDSLYVSNYGGLLAARLILGRFDEVIEEADLTEVELVGLRDYCGDPNLLAGKGIFAKYKGEDIELDSVETVEQIWSTLEYNT